MGAQEFLVDARLVVITLEMGLGDELNQVAITGLVFREQDEMIIDIASAAAGFLLMPAAGGDIDFAADDRLKFGFPGRPEKIDRAV